MNCYIGYIEKSIGLEFPEKSKVYVLATNLKNAWLLAEKLGYPLKGMDQEERTIPLVSTAVRSTGESIAQNSFTLDVRLDIEIPYNSDEPAVRYLQFFIAAYTISDAVDTLLEFTAESNLSSRISVVRAEQHNSHVIF